MLVLSTIPSNLSELLFRKLVVLEVFSSSKSDRYHALACAVTKAVPWSR